MFGYAKSDMVEKTALRTCSILKIYIISMGKIKLLQRVSLKGRLAKSLNYNVLVSRKAFENISKHYGVFLLYSAAIHIRTYDFQFSKINM